LISYTKDIQDGNILIEEDFTKIIQALMAKNNDEDPEKEDYNFLMDN
jgi:hypothetical protein